MITCDPKDIAMKSFFLGPGSENKAWVSEEMEVLLKNWYDWRLSQFSSDGHAISESDQQSDEFVSRREKFREKLHELIAHYEQEVPTFSPHYIGHMVSDTSLPALFGHIATLLHNPNNISNEVSKVGAEIEEEAIRALNTMIGYDPDQASGHFTSGGTVANIEALWRARYRLDHWLSLGAFQVHLGLDNRSSAELAMRGWEDFDACRGSHPVDDQSLRSYSFVANSPWEAVHQYDTIFQESYKGPVVLIPNSKHYSWQKAVSLLGLGESSFWSVKLTEEGRMSVEDLKLNIEKAVHAHRPVMMVVSVAGTTELGEVDPIDEIQDLLDEYKERNNWHIWHHVDAAYGGFFMSMLGGQVHDTLSPKVVKSFAAIRRADSVTIDPHKLGYIPYACGSLLTKTERHYQVSTFSAPYVGGNTKISRKERTLEGSRAATGAAATWLTAQTMGLDPEGLGRVLRLTMESKIKLKVNIKSRIKDCHFIQGDDLNVMCFCIASPSEPLSITNLRSVLLYEMLPQTGQFYVSKTHMKFENYGSFLNGFVNEWDAEKDESGIMVIRIVMMNPFFDSKEYPVDYSSHFVAALNKTLPLVNQKLIELKIVSPVHN